MMKAYIPALVLTGPSVSAYSDQFCPPGVAPRGDVRYAGNIGTPGHYGCNLMLVEDSVAETFQYIARLGNSGSERLFCVCFLKTGPDGQSPNGFWSPNRAFEFELAPGDAKHMAAQRNSQGGCTCGTGSTPLTPNKQYAGTWFEFDFGDEANGQWSGADASCLVAHQYGLPFQGLHITSPGPAAIADGTGTKYDVRSVIYPNGDGCNAFPGGTEAENGHGFNLEPGPVRFDVRWGTQGSIDDCPNISVEGSKWRQPAVS